LNKFCASNLFVFICCQVDAVTLKLDSTRKDNQKQKAVVEMQREEIKSQKATIQTLNQLIGKLTTSANTKPMHPSLPGLNVLHQQR
jgi:hypothetical protein